MTDRPDPYTHEWYQRRFNGMAWHLNRVDADYASADARIVELVERVDSLETALVDAQSEIGRLREELEVSMEKMREAYRELKTNGS